MCRKVRLALNTEREGVQSVDRREGEAGKQTLGGKEVQGEQCVGGEETVVEGREGGKG